MDEELENQAADLGAVIREILKQFQSIHAMAAEGPHAHLTHHELFLMEHLGEEGPQKMRSLAEYLGVAVNTMTTIIDGLENKGLVLRSRSQGGHLDTVRGVVARDERNAEVIGQQPAHHAVQR